MTASLFLALSGGSSVNSLTTAATSRKRLPKSCSFSTASTSSSNPARRLTNMRERLLTLADKLLLRKRAIIESVNDQLKNMYQGEQRRHCSPYTFLAHLLAGPHRLLSSAQEAVAAP